MVVKALFLDRDGVLNHPIIRDGKPFPPQTLKEFKIYDDVCEALNALKRRAFKLIVVTNQPDLGRGTQDWGVVKAMHKELMEKLPLDDIKMCTDEASEDYKPNPGMLFKAAKEFGINLKKSYMIGDRWRDVGAGLSAGCYRTILIDRGYGEEQKFSPDFTCTNFFQVASYIFKHEEV